VTARRQPPPRTAVLIPPHHTAPLPVILVLLSTAFHQHSPIYVQHDHRDDYGRPPRRVQFTQIFQKLERESERRALEESEEQDKLHLDVKDVERVPRRRSVPAASETPTDPATIITPDTAPRGRDRRRGSVVISIFGQPAAEHSQSGSVSPAGVSPLASAASKSPFYHSLANPHSVETLLTDANHDLTADAEDEDDQHVTTTSMQSIAGRTSGIAQTVDKVGALLSLSRTSTRRNRARASTLPAPVINTTEVVIGVSVVEATVDAHHSDLERSATVSADGAGISPRTRTAWMKDSIATKAKGIAQRFSRRNSYSDVQVADNTP